VKGTQLLGEDNTGVNYVCSSLALWSKSW